MHDRVCLRGVLHPGIGPIRHCHKVADVGNMRESVGQVSHSIHDAVLLEVDGNHGSLER